MNSMPGFLHRIGIRGVLLSLVVLLLLVKVGFELRDSYEAARGDLENRQASLDRYLRLTGKIPELKSQLQSLTAEREKLVKILFTGSSEENIISAMQLDLQALVTTAGLESETIRPVKQKNAQGSGGETGLGEVAIKASLTGTLAAYQAFLAELYRSGRFYKIEAVTLAPYKKSELKISIDLRGYFITTAPEAGVIAEGGGTGQPAKDSGI